MKPELTVLRIESPESLRRCAPAWDDLWARSEVTHPTAQAELIACWLDHFQYHDRFTAIVIHRGGRFLAALPLVTHCKGGVVTCMDVPGNEWSSAGQLLLDPRCNTSAVCQLLVNTLATLDCAGFWFASVPIHARWWQALVAAAREANWSVDARRRYQVGRLDLQGSWTDQAQLLSRGLRKRLSRSLRCLDAVGRLRLHLARPSRGDSALGLLESGLSLEHAGWKGARGSSVLAHDEAWEYMQDQARQLILKEQFAVALLELNGTIIAFEYGWCAKQVYHSYKVAYSDQYARYSPGHLMLYHLMRHFCTTQSMQAADFLGPVDKAIARWSSQQYWMGRLLMAPPSTVGRALVFASRYLLTGHTTPVLDAPADAVV